MASGDSVGSTFNLAAGAWFTYQPAAGVEVRITRVMTDVFFGAAPNIGYDARVGLWDGALYADFWQRDFNKYRSFNIKMFLTNSIYLRGQNMAGIAANMGYIGVIL